MKFKDYFISFLIIGLFTISIFYFAFGTAEEYGHDSSYMSSDKIDLSGIEQRLNQTRIEANETASAFTEDKLFFSTGVLVIKTIWTSIVNIWDSTILMFNLIGSGITNIFGLDPIVMGVVTSILLVGLIFSAWRVLKAGE